MEAPSQCSGVRTKMERYYMSHCTCVVQTSKKSSVKSTKMKKKTFLQSESEVVFLTNMVKKMCAYFLRIQYKLTWRNFVQNRNRSAKYALYSEALSS